MLSLLKCTRAVVSLELALLTPIMFGFMAGSYDLVNLGYTVYQVNNAAASSANFVTQLPSQAYTSANIVGVMESINSVSQPVNVVGPRTAVGSGQGALIVSVITEAASTRANPSPVPMLTWQCTLTSVAGSTPKSIIGSFASGATPAKLPPAAPGYSPIVMDMPDSAITVESYYLYSPFLFGSGFFGVGVFTLNDIAIYRPRTGSLSVPTGGQTPSSTGNVITVTGSNGQGALTTTGSC